MADAVPEERQRVTLTKAHCETPAGHELIELLAELSADGKPSRILEGVVTQTTVS